MESKLINIATSEEPIIDYLVAGCEGRTREDLLKILDGSNIFSADYCDNWSLAGEIIEREKIELKYNRVTLQWIATSKENDSAIGRSFRLAAMRCYLISKLGFSAVVPSSLLDSD
jgi:hypothetical protein